MMRSVGFVALFGGLAIASAAYAQGLAGQQRMAADANGDGRVTSAEYQKSRLDFIMRADSNKDGAVTKAEWDKGATMLRNQYEFDGVQDADKIGQGNWFTMIDANKDMSVNATEINNMTAARFTRLDTDKNGSINMTEGNRLLRAAQQGKAP